MPIFLEIIKELASFSWLLVRSLLALILYWIHPSKKKDISQDIVLITGGGGGLGRELARGFHHRGCTLILIDLNLAACQDTKTLIETETGSSATNVFVFPCDVSNYQSVRETLAEIRRSVGVVSILVNNAGVVNGRQLTEIAPEDYVKTISVNLLAHAWTVQTCLPEMVKRGRGHIVTIASILGLVACGTINDYCASKFGAVGFHQSLTNDLMVMRKRGIRGIHR